MENITGSLVVIGLIALATIFIVYMILSSRINSNMDKIEKKISDMKYDREERNLDISQRLRTLEYSFRDTERLLRNATLVKKEVQNAPTKTASNKQSHETSRNSQTSSSSRNSASDDNFSSSNLFHTTIATSSYTSPSSSDSCSSSSSYSDTGSSSSSCSDSSTSY